MAAMAAMVALRTSARNARPGRPHGSALERPAAAHGYGRRARAERESRGERSLSGVGDLGSL